MLYLVDKPGVEDCLEEVVWDSMLYLVDEPGIEDGLEEVAGTVFLPCRQARR